MADRQKYTRKTLPLDFADWENWPQVDSSEFTPKKLAGFERRKGALEMYLGGARIKEIEERWHISNGQILDDLNRCLSVTKEKQIRGWGALTGGKNVRGYVRKQDTSDWTGEGAGLSGAFRQFLDKHPDMEEALHLFCLKKKKRGDTHIFEHGHSFSEIYTKFLELCAEKEQAGTLSYMEYPFNTENEGVTPLRKFANDVRTGHFVLGAGILGGKDAAKRGQVGNGHAKTLVAAGLYDLFQLDEHTIDLIGTAVIETPKGSIRVPLQRMTLVLVADAGGQGIPGYYVTLKAQASAEDVVLTLSNAIGLNPSYIWKPRDLIVNYVSYKEGAGFPTAVFPQLRGACGAALMLDNATVHWSNAMMDRVSDRTGMAINWGPVATWVRRNVVENIFGILEKRGFHRLPNSTGRGPKDPHRTNPSKNAVNLLIDYEELLDLIDVVIANFNAEPNQAYAGRSYLDYLRDCLILPTRAILPHILPPLPAHVPDMDTVVVVERIKGDQASGTTPYVEYLYARYSNRMLAQAAVLIGRKVRLHVKPLDPRTAKVFFEDGTELGVLTARGSWGRIPHTLAIRQEVERSIRKGKIKLLKGESPITGFLKHVGEKIVEHKKNEKTPYTISKDATKAAHIARTTGQPIPPVDGPPKVDAPLMPPSRAPAKWPSFLPPPKFSGKAR